MGHVGVSEQVACKERPGKAGPAAVGPSAVDTCADGVLFIAENADTVIESSEEHNVLRNSVFPAKSGKLVGTDGKTASQGSVLAVIQIMEVSQRQYTLADMHIFGQFQIVGDILFTLAFGLPRLFVQNKLV